MTKTDTVKMYLSKKSLLPPVHLGKIFGRIKKITKIKFKNNAH